MDNVKELMVAAIEGLIEARKEWEAAAKEASRTRGYETNCLNRLNLAQRAVDKITETLKKDAPRDTDWNRPRGQPVA